jgi:hypothetical protein
MHDGMEKPAADGLSQNGVRNASRHVESPKLELRTGKGNHEVAWS